MAAPAKTSSSSLISCRTNPSMKKSETTDPMRRSFSGNPFTKPSIVTTPRAFNPYTPANSPSDFPRRHSTGRESVSSSRDFDKENTKDQKPTRVRSPAPSKGAKNFMSPTISAASKINASPRKKILVERNEPIRSSVSFSDVRGLIMDDKECTPETTLKQKKDSFSDVKSTRMEYESTPEICLNQKKVSFPDVESITMANTESIPKVSLKQKKVSFADVKSVDKEDNELTPQNFKQKDVDTPNDSSSSNHEHEVPLKSNADIDHEESNNDYDSILQAFTEEKDSCNVDSNFEISPRVPISPSCPVLAPLDADPSMPPYDPKNNYLSPRPQFLHYRPNPRIELYRERDGKQLEEHFGCESYSDSEVTEETESEEDSQRESEDISSEQIMEQQELEEEEEIQVTERNSMAPDMAEVESAEPKRMPKPRLFTRSKFITFLLVFAFAYFLIIVANSPAFTHSGFEELSLPSFQVPPEVTEFAKANFDRFTQNLQYWRSSFLSCVSNIISSSMESGPFRYANLSQLLEEHKNEGHLMFDDHSVLEPERKIDAGTELFAKKNYPEVEVEEEFEEQYEKEIEVCENLEVNFEEEPNRIQQDIIVSEMIEPEHLEAEENITQVDAEPQSSVEFDNQSSTIPQDSVQPDGLQQQIIVSELIEPEYLEAEENIAQIDAEPQSSVEFDNQPSIIPQDSVQPDGLQQEIIVSEMIEPEYLEAEENIAQIDAEPQSSVEFDNQPSIIPQATEVQDDVSKLGDTGSDSNIAETISTEEVDSSELKDSTKFKDFSNYSPSSEIVDSTINGTEDRHLTKNVMGLSLVVLCLLAVTAFINKKRGTPSMTNAAVPVEQPLLAKKKSEYNPQPSPSSMDTMPERVSESCPSEMSSCQRSSFSYSESSYRKNGVKESNEHHSQERRTTKNYSRESLASSDYSYGSFTTYEKRRNKYGGEEEVVTPIRRSSRIRNQVTSP